MLKGLDELGSLSRDSKQPPGIHIIYYIFMEKGITLTELEKLPIPYILAMLNVWSYLKKEEEKAYKKAKR